MIKVFSTQYLAENPDTKELFVLTVKDIFFLGMRIKHEEHSNYDLSLIDRYRPVEQPKKLEPIGFKTNNKVKKRKRNENKDKIS